MDFESNLPVEPPPPYPFEELTCLKKGRRITIMAIVTILILIVVLGKVISCYSTPEVEPITFQIETVGREPTVILDNTHYVHEMIMIDEHGNTTSTVIEAHNQDPESLRKLTEMTRNGLAHDLKLKVYKEKKEDELNAKAEQVSKNIELRHRERMERMGGFDSVERVSAENVFGHDQPPIVIVPPVRTSSETKDYGATRIKLL